MISKNYFSARDTLCKKHAETFLNLGVPAENQMLLEYALSRVIDEGYALGEELNTPSSTPRKYTKKEEV